MLNLSTFITAAAGTACAFILMALAATRIRHAYLRIGRTYTQLNPLRRQAPHRLVGTHRRHMRPSQDAAPIRVGDDLLCTYRITPRWLRTHRN